MTIQLSETQKMIRDMVKKLADKEFAPKAAMIDREKIFPWENIKLMAEHGMFGIDITEEYGGTGADLVSHALSPWLYYGYAMNKMYVRTANRGQSDTFDKLCKPEAIMGTNTSAIPVTEIASASSRGDKVIGIHFMNSVPLMKGVEIIKGQLTSDETMAATLNYIKQIGKESAVAVDYAGFIVSRLLDVLMNEAVKLVQEGNSPEEIDKAMQLCAGHPMGPCALLDLVGADIAMHGMETMERDFGGGYKPHPLLKKRVLAGLLGKKTGKGFYVYET